MRRLLFWRRRRPLLLPDAPPFAFKAAVCAARGNRFAIDPGILDPVAAVYASIDATFGEATVTLPAAPSGNGQPSAQTRWRLLSALLRWPRRLARRAARPMPGDR